MGLGCGRSISDTLIALLSGSSGGGSPDISGDGCHVSSSDAYERSIWRGGRLFMEEANVRQTGGRQCEANGKNKNFSRPICTTQIIHAIFRFLADRDLGLTRISVTNRSPTDRKSVV